MKNLQDREIGDPTTPQWVEMYDAQHSRPPPMEAEIGFCIPKDGVTLGCIRRVWRRGDLLDLGCDWGKLALFASLIRPREDCKVHGIDISSKKLESAEKWVKPWVPPGVITFEQAQFPPLPCKDKWYQVAVASDVLEHLPDWKEGIKEIRRVAHYSVLLIPRNNSWFWSPDHLWAFFDDTDKDEPPKLFPGHLSYDELKERGRVVHLSELLAELGEIVEVLVSGHPHGSWWVITSAGREE